MSGVIASLFVRVLPDTTGFRGSLTKTAETEGVSAGGIFKKAFSKGFAGIAAAVGVGSLVALTIDAAVKYQSTTATLAAQAGISMKAATAIGDAFLSTGGKTTFTAQAIMKAYAPVSPLFEQVAGHVLKASEALGVMTVAQHLAEATEKPLAETTNSLAQVMRAFGVSLNDAGKVGDILYNAGKVSGLGIDTLAAAMDKMKGKLGVLAPSIQDTATAVGVLAQHGITGTKGLMAFNAGLVTLEGGGKKTTVTVKGMKETVAGATTEVVKHGKAHMVNGVLVAGATTIVEKHGKAHTVTGKAIHETVLQTDTMGIKLTDAAGKFVGMSSIVEQLQPKLAKLTDIERLHTEQTLFGKAAAGTWDNLLRGGLSTWDEVGKKITETGTAQEAAEKKASTFHGTMEKLKAGVADAGVKIGEKLLPAMQFVADAFLRALPFVLKFSDFLQATVFTTIGKVFRGIGDALKWIKQTSSPVQGAIMGIAAALGVYVVALTAVKIATAAWAIVQGILNSEMLPIYIGIGLIVLVAAALGAVVWIIIKNWTHIVGFFTDVWRAVWGFMKTWGPLALAVLLPFIGIPLLIWQHWSSIVGFLSDVWAKVWGFLKVWGPVALAVLLPFIGIPLIIWQHWSEILEKLKAAWNVVTQVFWAGWNWLNQNVIQKFIERWNILRDGLNIVLADIRNGFKNAVDFIGKVWVGVQDVVKVPVQWIIDHVYTGGIEKIWNWVADHVGLPKLPDGPHLAGGGVLPGYAPGQDTIMAHLSPGEGVLVPEAVRALGPGAVDAINAKYGGGRRSTGTAFAGGGVVGNVIDWIGGALGKGIDILRDPATAVKGALGNNSFVSMMAQLPVTLIDKVGPALWSKVASLVGNALGITGGKSAGGGGVAQWVPVILNALSLLGQPSTWLTTVRQRMNQESGGNPTAVNRTDINWQHGTPSVGLMQVIGPTFRAWAGQFLNTGPFMYGTSVDPLANTYAGLNYAIHRYGSLSALSRPGGYDSGGWLMPPINGTGRPEAVLTPEESAGLVAWAKGGGKMGLDDFTIAKLAQAIHSRPNKVSINSPDWSIAIPGVAQ